MNTQIQRYGTNTRQTKTEKNQFDVIVNFVSTKKKHYNNNKIFTPISYISIIKRITLHQNYTNCTHSPPVYVCVPVQPCIVGKTSSG
jgi:hypothetical protein